MDWIIQIAERLLRRHPERITLLAPLCTFFLTVLVGTGHTVYALMPIICDISLKKGIRPERPCAIASIAAHIGVTSSPIAAAVIAFATISSEFGFHITNLQVVMVTIPSCIIGILAAVAYSWHRGLDLDKDPVFQAKLQDPEQRAYIYGGSATTLDMEIKPEAKRAVYIFLAALGLFVTVSMLMMFGVNVLPKFDGETMTMNSFIQCVMLTVAALLALFCKASPKKAVSGAVWQNGMVAVVAIYGIAWMSSTFIASNHEEIRTMLTGLVTSCPWAISIAFFVVSMLVNSQGAVIVSMLPLAFKMGIEPWMLLGLLPSVYAYFFFPVYPSDIATVNFDRSGTTTIGKYLLNHSFMAPGMIHIVVSNIVGTAISYVFHFWLGLY